MYSSLIIQHSDISNYSLNNQRDIVLDTADNLTQIGNWTLTCFKKEKDRIELFLALTRKNLNALHGFPLSPAFTTAFSEFTKSFDMLEAEYKTGIVDRKTWANVMLKWGTTLANRVNIL